jgi:recombination protein RecR
MEFSSKLIEKQSMKCLSCQELVRTALRLVLHLLKQPKEQTGFLSQALVAMRKILSIATAVITSQIVSGVRCQSAGTTNYLYCRRYSGCDGHENTGQFRGIYHVLGGKISPIDGVGPS